MKRENKKSAPPAGWWREKRFWNYVWRKLLLQDLSNHALCNIIFWFEPLRNKAWRELMSRNPGKRDLNYLNKHYKSKKAI